MTRREHQVLVLLAGRRTNAEIAEAMFVSVRTVESHVSALLRKFGATNRRDLVSAAAPEVAAVAVPLPLQAALAAASFVGREGALLALQDALAGVRPGRPTTVLVRGETGIGKTRLLAEFARAAGGLATIRLGRCQDGPSRPYQPFTELLESDAASRTDDELARLTAGEAAALAPIMPTLEYRVGSTGAAAVTRDDLFDAVGAYVERMAAGRPAAVVIEDVHWAEQGSLAMLRHLARSAVAAPVLLVVSVRDTDVTPEVGAVLADLRRGPGAIDVPLSGLALPAVAALVAEAGGAGGSTTASAVLRRSGGNPFFVHELLRNLGPGGTGQEGGRRLEELAVPRPVDDLVAQRIASLSPPSRRLLEVAAVLGSELDGTIVADAAGVAVGAAAAALEEAEHAGILVPATATATPTPTLAVAGTAWSWVHELVRAAVLRRLLSDRRMQIEMAVTEALLRRSDRHHPGVVAALAGHALAAGPLAPPELTADLCRAAAASARQRLAFEEAATLYDRALGALAATPSVDRGMVLDTRIALGEALARGGDSRFRAVLLDAATSASDARDGLRLADALLHLVPAGLSTRFGAPDPESGALVEGALDLLGPAAPGSRARLTALLACDRAMAGEAREAAALAGEALGLARQDGHPATLAFVLPRYYWVSCDPDDLAQRRRLMEQCIDASQQAGDAELDVYARALLVDVAVETGDANGAERHLAEIERRAPRLRQAFYSWLPLEKRSGLALLRGDLAEADRLSAEAFEVGAASTNLAPLSIRSSQLCLLGIQQGRAAEVVDVALDAIRREPGYPAWRALAALVYSEAGDLARAALLLGELAADGFSGLRRAPTWRSGLHCAAGVAVALADSRQAAALYDLLAPSAGRLDWFGGGSFGPTDLVLGELAALLGRPDAALRHLDASAALCRRLGARRYLARTRAAQHALR